MTLKKYFATIKNREKINEDTYQVDFILDDNSEDFIYTAGQYAMIKCEKEINDGRSNVRAFSIYSSPKKALEDKIISIVFRLPDNASEYKKHLVSCSFNEKIIILGPIGKFTRDKEKELIMIAGGTGIAPFMSMIKESNEEKSNQKITLIYTDKSKEKMIGLNELKKLEKSNEKLMLLWTRLS